MSEDLKFAGPDMSAEAQVLKPAIVGRTWKPEINHNSENNLKPEISYKTQISHEKKAVRPTSIVKG